MSDWYKVKCFKCGKEFPGEYAKGTFVFCNPCAKWIEAGDDDAPKGWSKARPRKAKV